MIENPDFLHYCTIALTVGINSIAVGIGEGLASYAALEAINVQPQARDEIATTSIMGMALIETSAIMGVSMAMILLLGTPAELRTFYFSLSEIGITLAICLPGFTLGLMSSLPTRSACFAIARQPFFGKQIMRFMLITQSIIQTPIIFGFITAMFIKNQAAFATTLSDALRLIASGLSIGLGSIGPAIGLAWFGKEACRGLGLNRSAYGQLLSFTFVSEAIIETPIVFSLVISLVLLTIKTGPNTLEGIALLAAGLCMGLGTLGAGISSGRTAATACGVIARNTRLYSSVSKVSMFAQGLIDTCAIYCLMVAFLLILFR